MAPASKGDWKLSGAARLDVSLPTRANGSLRIATGDYWLELTALDVADVEAAHHDGALVFADVAPSLDVMNVATVDRFEELRLARTIDAAAMHRWSLRLSPGMSARVIENEGAGRGDWVEVLDAQGHARMRSEPAFAVDSHSVRRSLRLRLEGSTLIGQLDTAGLTAPIAIDPAWTTTGSLVQGRLFAGMVALKGGKALYVGGQDGVGNALSSAELYDVSTGTWTSAGNLSEGRSQFAMDIVKGGAQVLVVGGEGGSTGASKAVDVYDVATGKWSKGTSLSTMTITARSCGGGPPRTGSAGIRGITGVASQDGNMFMTFGGDSDFDGTEAITRVYDMTGTTATAGTWRYYDPVGTVPHSGGGGWPAFRDVQNIRLKDGRVLGVGGLIYQGCPPSTSQLSPFGMITDKAFAGPPVAKDIALLPIGRNFFMLTELTDGRVIVVGGQISSPDGTAYSGSAASWLFDPAQYDLGKPAWSPGPLMAGPRLLGVLGTLPDGRVIAAGGGSAVGSSIPAVATAEILDLTIGSGGAWVPAGTLATTHAVAGGVMLDAPTGAPAFLVAGGTNKYFEGLISVTTTSELFAVASASTKCTGDGECASHHCVDGVCCDTACTGQCQACDVTGKVGTCSSVSDGPHGTRTACAFGLVCDGAGACKTTCAGDSDCTTASYFCDSGKCLAPLATGLPCTRDPACVSGHCADGACCESACGDLCAACDTPGLAGKCLPIAGKPHHLGAKCPGAGGADACAEALCDGKATATCATFVGSTISCRPASCKAGQATSAASCTGSGACPAADTKPCSNFLQCDAAGVSCLNECASDVDCLKGYSCQKGVCSAIGDQCSSDRLTVLHKDGTSQPCAPYFCNGIVCADTCATTADCQNGSVCDLSKHCVPSASDNSGSKGGCATSGKSSGGEGAALLGALIGFAAILRGKRARLAPRR